MKKSIAILSPSWSNRLDDIISTVALNRFLNSNGFIAHNIDYRPSWYSQSCYYVNPYLREKVTFTRIYNYGDGLSSLNDFYQTFIVDLGSYFNKLFLEKDYEAFLLSFVDYNHRAVFIDSQNDVLSKNTTGCLEEEKPQVEELVYRLSLFDNVFTDSNNISSYKQIGVSAEQSLLPILLLDKTDIEYIYSGIRYESSSYQSDVCVVLENKEIEEEIRSCLSVVSSNINISPKFYYLNDEYNFEYFLSSIVESSIVITDNIIVACFSIKSDKKTICTNKYIAELMFNLFGNDDFADSFLFKYSSTYQTKLSQLEKQTSFFKLVNINSLPTVDTFKRKFFKSLNTAGNSTKKDILRRDYRNFLSNKKNVLKHQYVFNKFTSYIPFISHIKNSKNLSVLYKKQLNQYNHFWYRSLFNLIPNRKINLIMTLLVKNEESIIETNIRFHHKMGVDGFIVTLHNCTDGTLSICQKLEAEGLILEIIEKNDPCYRQAEWCTEMSVKARDKYSADWIINADADEFYYSNSLDLKRSILKQPNANVIITDSIMVFPNFENNFLNNTLFVTRLFKKYETDLLGITNDRKYSSYIDYGMHICQKIFIKASDLISVYSGAHDADVSNKVSVVSCDIKLFHFSIRNYQGFLEKILRYLDTADSMVSGQGEQVKFFVNLYRSGGESALKEFFESEYGDKIKSFLLSQGILSYDPSLKHFLEYHDYFICNSDDN